MYYTTYFFFFFFNDTATTEIYTLSLHDALPISTAPSACPAGMVGVAAARGGFCIEIDRSFSGDFRKAEQACAGAGRRLCRLPEFRTACEEASNRRLTLKNMKSGWEWTGTYEIVR